MKHWIHIFVTIAILQSCSLAEVSPLISRAEVIRRAKFWTFHGISFNPTKTAVDLNGDSYRTDIPGFVSMAYRLPQNITMRSISALAIEVSKDDLQAGDLIANTTNPNSSVFIFYKWNQEKKWVQLYTFTPGGATYSEFTYPSLNRSGYVPYRFRHVADLSLVDTLRLSCQCPLIQMFENSSTLYYCGNSMGPEKNIGCNRNYLFLCQYPRNYVYVDGTMRVSETCHHGCTSDNRLPPHCAPPSYMPASCKCPEVQFPIKARISFCGPEMIGNCKRDELYMCDYSNVTDDYGVLNGSTVCPNGCAMPFLDNIESHCSLDPTLPNLTPCQCPPYNLHMYQFCGTEMLGNCSANDTYVCEQVPRSNRKWTSMSTCANGCARGVCIRNGTLVTEETVLQLLNYPDLSEFPKPHGKTQSGADSKLSGADAKESGTDAKRSGKDAPRSVTDAKGGGTGTYEKLIIIFTCTLLLVNSIMIV